MDFQLQQMYYCATVGKGVCITRLDAGRNCRAYTIMQC